MTQRRKVALAGTGASVLVLVAVVVALVAAGDGGDGERHRDELLATEDSTGAMRGANGVGRGTTSTSVAGTTSTTGAQAGPSPAPGSPDDPASPGSPGSPSGQGGGPAGATTATPPTTTHEPPPPPPPPHYGWGLPSGELDINEEYERDVYNGLVDTCSHGAAVLEHAWNDFWSPRNDFLYVAAVHVCRGEVDAGRRVFAEGEARYGWSGIADSEPNCLVYKAIVSVLDQVPQDGVECPGGAPPAWEDGPDGAHCDRPTTVEVEECPPPASESLDAGAGAPATT